MIHATTVYTFVYTIDSADKIIISNTTIEQQQHSQQKGPQKDSFAKINTALGIGHWRSLLYLHRQYFDQVLYYISPYKVRSTLWLYRLRKAKKI